MYKIKTGSLSRTFALSATPFEVKHNLGTVSGIKKVVNKSVCLKTDVNKEIRRGCQKKTERLDTVAKMITELQIL